MNFEYSPYILPLIAAAIVSATVAVYAWMRRSATGALALSLMSASIFVWTVGYSFEIAGTNIETKYFWGVIQYFGIAFAPYFWLMFAIVYSDNAKIISRRFIVLTALIPSITVLLALTTKWHGLVWSEYHIEQQDAFSAISATYGPWFWVHFAYSYIILLIGTILLVRALLRRRGMYRGQVTAMLVAVLTPWISNALYLTGNSPIPYLDLTPFAFTITVVALAWAVFGFHLVDITPLARDRVVDSMREGMIVLDVRGNVVDINNAAANMIGVPVSNAIGKTAEDVFRPWSHLVERFRNIMEVKDEISVGEGEAIRRYEVRLSHLQDPQGQLVGRVIMLRAMDEEALQQERDLLERLVEERTHELAAMRDESVKISNEFRKYFRAIEQSGNTIVITDIDGNIEYANPKFEQSTGYSIGEAKGKNSRILKSGRQSAEYYSQLWKTVSGGNSWNGEFLNKRKDGSLYWESATIAPVIDQNGMITNYVAIKEDITEQKFMQDQLEKQNDYLSILHQITLDLLNRREINDLLQVVVDRSAILLDAPFSQLMLEEDGVLIIESFTDNQHRTKGDRVTRHEDKLSWQAFDTHLPVVLEDYSTWEYRHEFYSSQTLHATADFPVMAGDRCLGILALGRSQPNYEFTAEQIETGILFARLVALVLDNASLYDSAMKEISERKRMEEVLFNQYQYLSALHKTTFELLQSRDVTSLLNKIAMQATELVEAHYGDIYLAEGDDLVLQAATNNYSSTAGNREKKTGIGVLEQVWQTLQPFAVENYIESEKNSPRHIKGNVRAVVGVPIIGREGPLGILEVARMDDDARKFTAQEVEMLGQFSSLASLVLDNAQLYAQAQNELSERQRAQVLLQESEARFRQIVENASDIIYRADMNGNCTYANPSTLKMMGYTGEHEVLGKNYLDLTMPEFRHKLKRVYDHQFISKTKSTYYEFPAVTVDGQIVWIGQNVQLILDGEQVIGFQAVGRNITQLRQAQEALALSRDQALDASRFKSQLLSRVSHELRTPLGGILGYAELLQYKAFGSLSEKQHNAVTNIIESTQYLTSIVNDLLDEAQIESKSLSLHNEYFNPVDLLEKIKPTMSTLADKKGVIFRAEIAPDLPSELYGDVKRLQQVIINLTGNAIKFTKQGEVSVCIKRPAPAHWSIEVQDTGSGILHSEHESIFEPFRQVNNSITRENRGSGLGLAITRQLVELMGGQISLESEIGRGSLFTVTLPITNAPGE